LTADQVVNSGTSRGSLPPTDLLDERSAGCPARDKRGFASDLAAIPLPQRGRASLAR